MGQVGPGGRTQCHGAGEAGPSPSVGKDSRQWDFLVRRTGCLLLSCLLSSVGGADICGSHWDPYSQCSPRLRALCATWCDKNQGIKKVLMPGLASQGRSEFKKQQKVKKSCFLFWLSKGTDTSEGVPADPAPDLGTLMHGMAVSSSLSCLLSCP